jgi:two-component system, NarL family, nitrate/nitrite response regulator NarL
LHPVAASEAGDPITILLIDLHEMVVEGVAAVMREEPDMQVLGAGSSAADALRLALEIRPDVVVMADHLSDADGVEAARRLRKLTPEVSVVMLSSLPERDIEALTLARAVDAGCSGFISKAARVGDLIQAVRWAARGYAQFPLSGLRRSEVAEHDLTPREMEVLNLLAAGANSRSIALLLTLSQHTVRNHVRNLLAKLGAHSQLEAVVIASRRHLIKQPGLNT